MAESKSRMRNKLIKISGKMPAENSKRFFVKSGLDVIGTMAGYSGSHFSLEKSPRMLIVSREL